MGNWSFVRILLDDAIVSVRNMIGGFPLNSANKVSNFLNKFLDQGFGACVFCRNAFFLIQNPFCALFLKKKYAQALHVNHAGGNTVVYAAILAGAKRNPLSPCYKRYQYYWLFFCYKANLSCTDY